MISACGILLQCIFKKDKNVLNKFLDKPGQPYILHNNWTRYTIISC